ALYPQAASLTIFAFMCLVLLTRPQGLFGIAAVRAHAFHAAPRGRADDPHEEPARPGVARHALVLAIAAALVAAPTFIYPLYLMKIFCFAIFAAAFNFLLGFAGIVSFGQAALFGTAAYLTAHALKQWALPVELSLAFGVGAATLTGLVMGAL